MLTLMASKLPRKLSRSMPIAVTGRCVSVRGSMAAGSIKKPSAPLWTIVVIAGSPGPLFRYSPSTAFAYLPFTS